MADVLAERESSRECAWVGELGAWAQFRTTQLPSRRETQHESSIQRLAPGDPGEPGLAAEPPAAGGS